MNPARILPMAVAAVLFAPFGTRVQAQPNNGCFSPQDVDSGTYNFNNTGATTDGPTECGSGDPQIYKDLWYRFYCECSGFLRVNTCVGATFDTKLAIYGSGCPGGPGTALYCNDDGCGASGLLSCIPCNPQLLGVPVSAGVYYWIRVGGYVGNQSGTGTLNIFFTPSGACGPSNNLCGGAINVGQGSTAFSNVGATRSVPDDGVCVGGLPEPIQADVWFRFRALCDDAVTIDTCGSSFQTKLYVYLDQCMPPTDASTLLGCARYGSGCTTGARVTVNLTGGQTYLVRVGGEGGATGNGVLNISSPGCTRPFAEITSPTPLACVCNPAIISGSANAPGVKFLNYTVEYRPILGSGWTQIVSSSSPVTGGTLASWNTLLLPEGYYFIRVTALDTYGRTSEATSVVYVSQQFDGLALTSPVSNGFYGGPMCILGTIDDNCGNTFTIEYAAGPIYNPYFAINGGPPSYSGGHINDRIVDWNTNTVADGQYRLRVTGTNICSQTASLSKDITIDNTPPVGVISSPTQCHHICGLVPIVGTATDTNFGSWVLQYTGGASHGWTTIASGNSQVGPGGTFTNWDVSALAHCDYTVRLIVGDKSVINCYYGPNTTEYLVSVSVGPAGDFDLNGAINSGDVTAFLNAWFRALSGMCE